MKALLRGFALFCCVAMMISCGGGSAGGGGSATTSSTGSNSGAPLVITTASTLPDTLDGSNYSMTFQATGGLGTLTWKMEAEPYTPLPDGLSLDPATGVLSGIPTFQGIYGFVVSVTDTSSHQAQGNFSVTGYMPLTASPTLSISTGQYGKSFSPPSLPIQGGVPPLMFSNTLCLPPGITIAPGNPDFGVLPFLSGAPLVTGTFPCTVTVTDSYSTPETISQPIIIVVSPQGLAVSSEYIPSTIVVNRPFSSKVDVLGGTPPYHFSPPGFNAPGITLDPSTGVISGTPTAVGTYGVFMQVTDSSNPAQMGNANVGFTVVAAPLGRNDTPATATKVGNGVFNASLSPYIDPPNGAPAASDQDYYSVVADNGATVIASTTGSDFVDTVMEITDANGSTLSICNLPGSSDTTFTSLCVNDDISDTNRGSQLSAKPPGDPNLGTTLLIHVVDWKGLARPDMDYSLSVSGALTPLVFMSTSHFYTERGNSSEVSIFASSGAPSSYVLTSGALPPGLSMDSTGLISGVPTTDGSYTFSVTATDTQTPPQSATGTFTIQVVEPFLLTGPSVWPAACLNQTYSYTVQSSGGAPPFNWSEYSNLPGSGLKIDNQGNVTGIPTLSGTLSGSVFVNDGTGNDVIQNVTLTVNSCP